MLAVWNDVIVQKSLMLNISHFWSHQNDRQSKHKLPPTNLKIKKSQKNLFLPLLLPTNERRKLPNSALASKFGQIQKIKVHHFCNLGLCLM